MNHRFDSAQLVAFAGSASGFALANFDRLAATLCALVGVAYTVWKWRREIRRGEAARSASRPPLSGA